MLCGACVGKPACYRPTMIEATEREREVIHSETREARRERTLDRAMSLDQWLLASCRWLRRDTPFACRAYRLLVPKSERARWPLVLCVTQPAPYGRRRVFGPSRPPWSQRLCALSAALLSQAGAPRPRSLAAYGGADAPSGRCGVVYQAVATLRPSVGLPSPRLGPVRSHGGSCAQLSHHGSNA